MATSPSSKKASKPLSKKKGKAATKSSDSKPRSTVSRKNKESGAKPSRASSTKKSKSGKFLDHTKLLDMIAQGRTLKKILTELTLVVEGHYKGTLCSIHLLDPKKGTLNLGAAPNLPKKFLKAFKCFEISPTDGTCGPAAYFNKVFITKNIETDPLWDNFRELPLSLGIISTWSTPIHNPKGKVVGTICVYNSAPNLPKKADREIIQQAAHLAGIAINRQNDIDELKHTRDRLEEVIAERTAELTEAIRQLQDEIVERCKVERSLTESNEKLKNLSNHLQTVREEERAVMSREIHDELGQMLTTLKMELSLLDERREEEKLPIKDDVDSMTRLVETTLETVRRLSLELRPGILDVLGLAEALEWQVQDFQKRARLRAQTRITRETLDLNSDQATALFRICQESLTNITRHAKATLVQVSLQTSNGNLILQVQDNGQGITQKQSSHPASLGLIGMKERVQILGGTVKVEGQLKKGTKVTASIPLEIASK